MSPPPIMITPKGYDDVNSVLQRLGGSLANTRQLAENEMVQLGKPAFLSGVDHLFFNCHESIQVNSASITVIRDFVNNGGTLYASDWASSVVEAAFGYLAKFSARAGAQGIVQARVSDPYLAQRLGNSIPIKFDMAKWVLIKKFPTSADVYIMDVDRKPLAVGFRVGRGRVVFTSFHHHAQQVGSQSAVENALLERLVTLPTRHKLLLSTGLSLAQHRVASSTQMMGQAGNERQVMPVTPGNVKGLGVFVLSWDRDESVEFSMRYLRDREIAEAEKRSSNPPLVMTVRNPGNDDGVEIRRHVSGDSRITHDELKPYVFASGMRRDLLGDPDWFASSVIRHMQVILEGDTTLDNIRERLTVDHLESIIQSILSGLSYHTNLRSEQSREDRWTVINAWPKGTSGEIPDIQAEVAIAKSPISLHSGEAVPADEFSGMPSFYPIHGDLIPGTERLLVYLTFSSGGGEDSQGNGWPRILRSSSDRITWRAICSERLSMGRERETISTQEFLDNYHANITVYRAEEEVEEESVMSQL